jgi:hypothetical protein
MVPEAVGPGVRRAVSGFEAEDFDPAVASVSAAPAVGLELAAAPR